MSDQPGYVAPAAWYVDPLTSQNLRWWSGLEWTDHVAPLPEVVSSPSEDDRMPTPVPGWAPVETAAATSVPEGPASSSRRAQREGSTAETTIAPPPPTPLIAPVTAFDWGHEVEKDSPRVARMMARVDEYRFIPSRWGTASVWLLAFSPWIAVLFMGALVLLVAFGVQEFQLYAAAALPSLVTLALAQRDHKRLRAWGHTNVAHWAWSLLGVPAYLIARSVVLRTHTGVGSLPLWIWVVNLFAAAGACLVLILPLSVFLAPEAY